MSSDKQKASIQINTTFKFTTTQWDIKPKLPKEGWQENCNYLKVILLSTNRVTYIDFADFMNGDGKI